jgi:hypothetical protein
MLVIAHEDILVFCPRVQKIGGWTVRGWLVDAPDAAGRCWSAR